MSERQHTLQFGVDAEGFMTFNVGNQRFTLNYKPFSAHEFDIMSAMLTRAIGTEPDATETTPKGGVMLRDLSSFRMGGCPFCGRQDCVAGACRPQNTDALLEIVQKELSRLKKVANCGTVENWLKLTDSQKRDWFAVTLSRDSAHVKRIRHLEGRLAEAVAALEETPYEERTARQQSLLAALKSDLEEVTEPPSAPAPKDNYDIISAAVKANKNARFKAKHGNIEGVYMVAEHFNFGRGWLMRNEATKAITSCSNLSELEVLPPKNGAHLKLVEDPDTGEWLLN